jgi:hypothetical protein
VFNNKKWSPKVFLLSEGEKDNQKEDELVLLKELWHLSNLHNEDPNNQPHWNKYKAQHEQLPHNLHLDLSALSKTIYSDK